MIMLTAKFRNNISNYKQLFYYTAWSNYNLRKNTDPKRELLPEDIMVLEMIENIDFVLLYKSVEFRSKLRERLKYYNVKVEH